MSIRTGLKTSFLALILWGCGGQTASNNENSTTESTTKTEDVAKDSTEGADSEQPVGKILAKVEDIEIGSNEWHIIAARKTPADGKALSAEEKRELLDDLIEQKLLYLHAKKKGIDRDPKVQKLMVQTLMRKEVYATVRNSDFSQEELQAYFEEHREDFVVPEKVQVRRIFVKVGEKRSADDAKSLLAGLRDQLVKSPEQFKTLAKENSEDPYRKRGGDLGFLARDGKPGVPEEVTEKAFAMNVGDLSEVFEAGGGYNIISIVNRRERVERTYEQMKGSVLRKMKADKFRALFDDYVDGIRDGYNVTKNEDVLDGIEVKPPRRFSMGGGPGGSVPQLATPPALPPSKKD